MRLLTFVFVALLFARPVLAKPGTADCLWSHSPRDQREATAAGLGDVRAGDTINGMKDPKVLGNAMAECGVDASKLDVALALWGLVIFRQGMLGDLSSRAGVSEERILATIATMPDADRRAITNFVATKGSAEGGMEVLAAPAKRLAKRLRMDDIATSELESFIMIVFLIENMERPL